VRSRALLRTRGLDEVLRPEVRDPKVSESGLGEGATRESAEANCPERFRGLARHDTESLFISHFNQ